MIRYTLNSDLLFDDLKLGKAGAFEFVFKTYQPRLRAYASRFITSPDDLNDILQDCFVRLWENRERLTRISISSLLYTMVRNACLNFLRHQMVANQYSFDELPQQQGAEQLYSLIFNHNAEEELVYEELRRQINEVLDSLPEQSKTIFKMSREEDLLNREIAERLGISVKTVEYHITKVLCALRSLASKYDEQALMVLAVAEAMLLGQTDLGV